MKKIIIYTLVIVAITAASCKKEKMMPQAPITPNEYNVSARNNLLSFETIEDFEKTITNPTPANRAAFLKTIGNLNNFTPCIDKPYFRGSIETAINDDFLKSILNTDLAIQIGENIFRVNPLTEKVYALPVANEEQYNDLVNENTGNPNIQVFSTNDEVLELIEAKKLGNRGIFCNETGVNGDAVFSNKLFYKGNVVSDGINVPTDKYLYGRIEYNRAGIYNSLFADVRVTTDAGGQHLTDDQVGIYVEPCYYHIKCGRTEGEYNTYTASGGGGKHRFQSYQGPKQLNEIYLRVKFTCEGHETNWLQKRLNH